MPHRRLVSLFVAFAFVVTSAVAGRAEEAAPADAAVQGAVVADSATPAPAAAPAPADPAAASADAPAPVPKPAGPAGPAGPAAKKPVAKKPSAKAAPAKGIQLSRTTPLEPGINVHPEVLSECMIQTKLPQWIADRAPSVTLVDKAGGPNRLELKILDIHAPNGGMFSGPKWLVVEGRLFSGGVQKGNFTEKLSSMASTTACGMLDKVMRAMAADIAGWIAHPTKNATLTHRDEDDEDEDEDR